LTTLFIGRHYSSKIPAPSPQADKLKANDIIIISGLLTDLSLFFPVLHRLFFRLPPSGPTGKVSGSMDVRFVLFCSGKKARNH
jgi:hypothetical protein